MSQDHVCYKSLAEFMWAQVGCTMQYLFDAFQYHITSASANEAEGSLKVGMPGYVLVRGGCLRR